MEWFSYGLLMVLLLSFIGMLISFLIRKRMQLNKQATELEQPATPSTLVVVGATVQRKEVSEEVMGSPKMPKRNILFSVVFVTDEGEQKVLQVEESVFAFLKEGDSGALALQNDAYYDFQPTEQPVEPQNQE
ncbi:MAG: DUF2500 family protein [Clostridia bacterium]|nr:DUF2500 family protein [Clostridia bacterium]